MIESTQQADLSQNTFSVTAVREEVVDALDSDLSCAGRLTL